jgi:hypothetical protein
VLVWNNIVTSQIRVIHREIRSGKHLSRMDNSEKLAKLGTQNEDKKNHNAICVGHYQAFELIRPENYSALCKSGLKQMRP